MRLSNSSVKDNIGLGISICFDNDVLRSASAKTDFGNEVVRAGRKADGIMTVFVSRKTVRIGTRTHEISATRRHCAEIRSVGTCRIRGVTLNGTGRTRRDRPVCTAPDMPRRMSGFRGWYCADGRRDSCRHGRTRTHRRCGGFVGKNNIPHSYYRHNQKNHNTRLERNHSALIIAEESAFSMEIDIYLENVL